MAATLQPTWTQLVSILEVPPVGSCIISPEGEVLYANPTLVAELGPWEGRSCPGYLAGFDSPCNPCVRTSGEQELGRRDLELTCPSTGRS